MGVAERAYMTDSSVKGYAVIEGDFSEAEILACTQWRERWRFKENRAEHSNSSDLTANSMLSAASAQALSAEIDYDVLYKDESRRGPPAVIGREKKSVRTWQEEDSVIPLCPLFFCSIFSIVGSSLGLGSRSRLSTARKPGLLSCLFGGQPGVLYVAIVSF
jgi:hypothetical protein